jgi:hypothetical protein
MSIIELGDSMLCDKCCKLVAALLAALGVCLLLTDLGMWDFWGISWSTGVILIAALCCGAKVGCPGCKKC